MIIMEKRGLSGRKKNSRKGEEGTRAFERIEKSSF